VLLVALVLTGALVAWIITVDRMLGMDAGPGTDLGGVGWYLGIWVTMMAAMMLPSAAPMVLLYARVARDQARQGRHFVPTWVFVAGYLAAWTLYGLVAYGIFRAIVAAGTDYLAWERSGRYVAGGALLLSGIYQLTPLKDVCLRHCRSPLHFLLHKWHRGWLGAFRMGFEHGAFCVGCCWGLMLALFALGVMSLFWMAVVAVVILAEKVSPKGEQLARVFAVCLVALGVWVAAAPASVPGLVQPNSHGADLARMKMMNMSPAMSPEPMEKMPTKMETKPAKMETRPPAMPMEGKPGGR
jgi:predicted metal-binding membrane protein